MESADFPALFVPDQNQTTPLVISEFSDEDGILDSGTTTPSTSVESETSLQEDPDFELMFSRTDEAIVGSYRLGFDPQLLTLID